MERVNRPPHITGAGASAFFESVERCPLSLREREGVRGK